MHTQTILILSTHSLIFIGSNKFFLVEEIGSNKLIIYIGLIKY